jgi:hypothetical protein
MGRRCLLSLAVVLVSASLMPGARLRIVHRVHEPNICWDPDVEFPVSCDEDGD